MKEKFVEKHGSIFLFDMELNKVIYEMTKPTVLFDKEDFTLFKLGNRENVELYYEKQINKCKQRNSNLYEDWILMDLPLDTKILNRVKNNNTAYLETFIREKMPKIYEELKNIK